MIVRRVKTYHNGQSYTHHPLRTNWGGLNERTQDSLNKQAVAVNAFEAVCKHIKRLERKLARPTNTIPQTVAMQRLLTQAQLNAQELAERIASLETIDGETRDGMRRKAHGFKPRRNWRIDRDLTTG